MRRILTSRPSRRASVLALFLLAGAVAAAVAGATLLAACGGESSAAPAGKADITGPIATVNAADDGTTVTGFLIDRGSGGYDKASVRVDEDTAWYSDARGTVAAVDPPSALDLQGKTVEVQFTGAVAESYPVQATAGWVIVHD